MEMVTFVVSIRTNMHKVVTVSPFFIWRKWHLIYKGFFPKNASTPKIFQSDKYKLRNHVYLFPILMPQHNYILSAWRQSIHTIPCISNS